MIKAHSRTDSLTTVGENKVSESISTNCLFIPMKQISKQFWFNKFFVVSQPDEGCLVGCSPPSSSRCWHTRNTGQSLCGLETTITMATLETVPITLGNKIWSCLQHDKPQQKHSMRGKWQAKLFFLFVILSSVTHQKWWAHQHDSGLRSTKRQTSQKSVIRNNQIFSTFGTKLCTFVGSHRSMQENR